MKVSVEIITGTFIDTEVSENATVNELKEKIATSVKLAVNRLILVVGNEEKRRMVMENENEMLLRDLGVTGDSHMYLFFKHPDLVSKEVRSRGGDDNDDSMEEISSEPESSRGNEKEEKGKIDREEEDKEMKNEGDRDEKTVDVVEEEKGKHEEKEEI